MHRTAKGVSLIKIAQFMQGRTLLQRVVGNTLWQLTDKILRMAVNLFLGFWVARYLGPDRFGLLNFAIAFVALFSPLTDLGMQAVVVRDLVRRPEDRLTIIASGIGLRFFGSLVAAILAVGYTFLTDASDANRILVAAVALSLLPQAWDVIDFDFQSRMNARPIVIIRTVSLIVFAIVKVALILRVAEVIWFAAVIAGEAALSALCMRVLFKSQVPQFDMRYVSRMEIRRLLQSCWPVAISSLSVVLFMRIDQVMIGEMLGAESVGIFSAAVRVSEAWYFIPMAITSAIAPALTAAHASSAEDYRRKMLLVIRAVLLISLVFAAPLAIWSDELVGMLYGASYEGAGSILAIHAWAGVFAALGVAAGPWFVNAGMLKTRMVHTVIGALVNVLLNLMLIPRMGPVGAAIATLVSYSLASVWLNVLSRRTAPIFRLQLRAFVVGT